MTLNFTFTEADALAFSARYLGDHKSHRAIRTRVRWLFPCVLIVMGGNHAWRHGLSWFEPIYYGCLAFAGWFFYPRWFDARIRAHAKKTMGESSYAKRFGAYELQLLDEHMHSASPLGSGTYTWTGVDRVILDSDYLFIFLSGPAGYAIRISEIGQETAQQAHDFVAERIGHFRQMNALPNEAL